MGIQSNSVYLWFQVSQSREDHTMVFDCYPSRSLSPPFPCAKTTVRLPFGSFELYSLVSSLMFPSNLANILRKNLAVCLKQMFLLEMNFCLPTTDRLQCTFVCFPKEALSSSKCSLTQQMNRRGKWPLCIQGS